MLASSFTDYWRRVNNPLYLRFKGSMGLTATLVVTTLIAFAATWALHSYQWFRIRGSFPVIWQDIVFWGVMGLLVLSNMVWEQRRGRARSLTAPKLTLKYAGGLALRTIGTFLVISVSWSRRSASPLSAPACCSSCSPNSTSTIPRRWPTRSIS